MLKKKSECGKIFGAYQEGPPIPQALKLPAGSYVDMDKF
jgi:hypothetical protein